ncbi:MAG: hypothetical protein JNL60_15175 [Bacteroidia bacterium]|nr:hypothetical protein [Bacteroidia bacterium]
MKNNKLILSIGLGALLFTSGGTFTSCKKDDKKTEEDTPPVNTQSNTEKILDKTFKVTAISLSTPIGSYDMYSQLKDCEKDNLFTFKTAGLYTEDEGPTKCDQMDNQQKTGTWKWENNETQITVTANGQTITSKVVSNDGTIFKTSVEKDTMGIKATVITMMTKQ